MFCLNNQQWCKHVLEVLSTAATWPCPLCNHPPAHHLLPGHADDQWGAPQAAEGPILFRMWLFPMPNPRQGTWQGVGGASLEHLRGRIPVTSQRILLFFYQSSRKWLSGQSGKRRWIKTMRGGTRVLSPWTSSTHEAARGLMSGRDLWNLILEGI